MSLARIGIRGALFTSLSLAFRQLVSLSATFYVARQLVPADLGLFAMVMVVIGFAQVIGDVGIATGLVRSQTNSSTVLSTCFWVSASIGCGLALMIFLLAPAAAWFYEKAEVEPILRVSAIGILVNFLTPVPMALLQQRLAYKEIAICQGLSSLTGALTAVALVYAGLGVWGLVFQPIAGNLLILGMMTSYARWHPRFEFQFSSARDILTTGVHLLGAGLTGYLRNNFDTLVIGKALLAKDLGLYGMAQTILYAPMHLITSTVARVIFPLLAKIQDDPEKVSAAVLTATSRTALLIFPLYFGLFLLADEFVLLVFGVSWMDMVPLIRIMTLSFLTQSIGTFSGPLMLALGKSKMVFLISVCNVSIYLLILIILIPYGLINVAIGYAVANTVMSLISLGFALYYARIKLFDYMGVITRPLILALSMCFFVFFIRNFLGSINFISLILNVIAGGVCYVFLVYLFERKAWIQVAAAIRKEVQ